MLFVKLIIKPPSKFLGGMYDLKMHLKTDKKGLHIRDLRLIENVARLFIKAYSAWEAAWLRGQLDVLAPFLTATSSAAMDMAISAGVLAPMLMPMGE